MSPPFPFQSLPKPDLDKQCGAMCFQPARRCIYDQSSLKYLVQTRDDVEAGDEKIKELESEMKECGLYDTDFSLGDLLDEGEEEGGGTPQTTNKKKKLDDYPSVEGDETLTEYIGQYKRACLNKKAMLKSTKDRLEKDKVAVAEYKLLGCKKCNLSFSYSD